MKHGDFTSLAENYAQYRPGYSPFVLDVFCSLAKGKECADIGAGTGIWSRQLAGRGIKVTAVEPNDAMRSAGIKQTGGGGKILELSGLTPAQRQPVSLQIHLTWFAWLHLSIGLILTRLLKNFTAFLSRMAFLWPSGIQDILKPAHCLCALKPI